MAKTRNEFIQQAKAEVGRAIADKKILINYIRDFEGNPWGVVVGTRDGVGVSIQNPRDKWVKHIGIRTAMKRANDGLYSEKIDQSSSFYMTVVEAEDEMTKRAIRYFGGVTFEVE